METLERLLAFEEIRHLKARYFRCLDEQDLPGLANTFTADAVFDMRAEVAGMRASGVDMPPDAGLAQGRDNIIAMIAGGLDGVVTVHRAQLPEIVLHSADEASGSWLLEDIHRMPEGAPVFEMRGFGRYHEKYRREPDGWRIAHLEFVRLLKDVTLRDAAPPA